MITVDSQPGYKVEQRAIGDRPLRGETTPRRLVRRSFGVMPPPGWARTSATRVKQPAGKPDAVVWMSASILLRKRLSGVRCRPHQLDWHRESRAQRAPRSQCRSRLRSQVAEQDKNLERGTKPLPVRRRPRARRSDRKPWAGGPRTGCRAGIYCAYLCYDLAGSTSAHES
jgi:hypothetical protein